MYDNWVFNKWETPLSAVGALELQRLTDCNGFLEIVCEDLESSAPHLWIVIFQSAIGYRSLGESFRNQLWKEWDINQYGRTVYVENSDFLLALVKEPVTENLRHFMIVTRDDVIEVLSVPDPQIIEL